MARPSLSPAPSELSADVSLSDLARALVAPGPREGAALESPVLSAQREARADLARALASLGSPVRALTNFTTSELQRGGALLRARVLRGAFGASASLRAQANDPSQELAATENEADASSARSQRAGLAAADGSFRAFVLLTRSDRTLLSILYAAAQSSGSDLALVDDVARALLSLRQRERAANVERAPDNDVAPRPSMLPTPSKAPPAELESEANAAPPWLARSESYAPGSYGNAAQFAARVVSSYRSLLPPPGTTPSMPPPEAAPANVDATRPFSAVEALGLSTLVSSLNKKQLVARRPRRRPKTRTRARAEVVAPIERDDSEPEMGHFARWDELFRRRRAQRRENDSGR